MDITGEVEETLRAGVMDVEFSGVGGTEESAGGDTNVDELAGGDTREVATGRVVSPSAPVTGRLDHVGDTLMTIIDHRVTLFVLGAVGLICALAAPLVFASDVAYRLYVFSYIYACLYYSI